MPDGRAVVCGRTTGRTTFGTRKVGRVPKARSCTFNSVPIRLRARGVEGFLAELLNGRRKLRFPAPVFSPGEDDPVTTVMGLTRCGWLLGRPSSSMPLARTRPQSISVGCCNGRGTLLVTRCWGATSRVSVGSASLGTGVSTLASSVDACSANRCYRLAGGVNGLTSVVRFALEASLRSATDVK